MENQNFLGMVHMEPYTPRHASADHEPPDERAAPFA